jgi:hypothetical protein
MAYYTIQRTNCVKNPRASVDVKGWDSYNEYVVRVEITPVSLPDGATTAFAVPGTPTGLPAISDHWALPADVEPGEDYLFAGCWAYVDGVAPHKVSFWGSLKFFDSDSNEISWMAFAHDEQAPLDSFEPFVGLIKVPEGAETFHVFIKVDAVYEDDEMQPDLYFTKVFVENAYGRARLPFDYADGDSDGWSWTGTAHDSYSLKSTTEESSIIEPTETELTIPSGAWLTLDPMTEDLFLGVIYGAPECYFRASGINAEFSTLAEIVEWGTAFEVTWTAEEGYDITDVLLDEVSIGICSSKSWSSFTEDHAIHVDCEAITVTVNYIAAEHGTITGTATQNITYDTEGGTQVTAVPDEGYVFVEWSDGRTIATRSDRDLLEDADLTATFALAPDTSVTLTYTAGDHGSLEGDTEQEVTIGLSGTPVEAIPDAGYSFEKWDDDAVANPRIEVAVSVDVTVEASFILGVYHTLAYTAGANGSITGDTSQTVEDGKDGTVVKAVADSGYRFNGWSDGGVTAQRCEFVVEDDLSVTASFVEVVEEPASYSLTYVAGAHGSIQGSASQTVTPGANGSRVTAFPETGYVFVGWSDDYPAPSRIAAAVHADLSVTATFAVLTHTLRYSTCRHGDITGTTKQTVAHGGSGTQVTAVPHTGYHFVKWSDGDTSATRTDNNVSASRYLWARMRRDS